MCGHVNVAKWAAQVNLAITQWKSERPRGQDAASTRASVRASDNAAAGTSDSAAAAHGTKPTEERDPRLIHI